MIFQTATEPRLPEDNYVYVFVILTIATRFFWWLYIYTGIHSGIHCQFWPNDWGWGFRSPSPWSNGIGHPQEMIPFGLGQENHVLFVSIDVWIPKFGFGILDFNDWLVVWNMFYDFPYIGNHPNWLVFFKGLKPPTRIEYFYRLF